MQVSTRIAPAAWLRAFSALLLAAAAGLAATSATAQTSPGPTGLRPLKGISYQPSPSDDCQLQTQYNSVPPCSTPLNGYNPTYYDTDFYNTDFALLWGPGTPAAPGRNDLATLKAQGINFLHIYNWNAQRDHGTFLTAVVTNGMKVMVPVSNYTACLIVGGCQGVGAGSYQNAYNNVQAIFNQVYTGSTLNPGIGAWGIFNEYDYNNIDPVNVAFVIQAILQLEAAAGVTGANLLPFMVPASNAVNSGSSYAWFQTAQAIYQAIPNANANIPAGVLANIAVSVALQNAQTNATVSYGGVTVAPVPTGFWAARYIATVNPFTSGPTINAYITSANQFQSAFPAATVTTPGQVWNAAWNTLPPLFLSEMGINIGGSGSPGTPQTQAAWVLQQLQCTNPWAMDTVTTYFLGSNIFEFEYEGSNGHWGMFTFPTPASYTTGTTTSGASYRVDKLNAQPAWNSVLTGFQTTAKSCS
ncbi:MAG: hypothetical protein ABI624_09960 [Casimicrobiaceae bacterium]